MAFHPHIGTCSCGCNEEGLVVVKKGYIQQCNHRIKQEKKANKHKGNGVRRLEGKEKKRVFSSLKNKIRKPTGELELFWEIFNERPHYSELSGLSIPKFDVRCFMHVLSKGAYPAFRLKKENILLGLVEEHEGQHNGTLDEKLMDKFKAKQQELKQQYYNVEQAA